MPQSPGLAHNSRDSCRRMAYDASATPAPATHALATHALATRGVANHRRPNHRRQAPGAEKHQPQLRSRSPLPATCVEGSWIDLCCVSRLSPKFKHHHNGKTRALIPASKHATSGCSLVGLNLTIYGCERVDVVTPITTTLGRKRPERLERLETVHQSETAYGCLSRRFCGCLRTLHASSFSI